MNELSKTQKLQAQRDKIDAELTAEEAKTRKLEHDLLSEPELTEESSGRIMGADKFMRRVDAHMLLSNERWTQVCKTLSDLQEHGFRRCEGERVRIEHLESSDKEQWTAINRTVRTPRQKTMAWGAGGVGIGGAVIVVLDWVSKHWGGNTP